MLRQVSYVSSHQTSKVLALTIGAISLLIWPMMMLSMIPMMLTEDFSGAMLVPLGMVLLLPVIYLFFGYVMSTVTCWIYNFIAKRVGGIEYKFVDVEPARPTDCEPPEPALGQ